MLSLAVTTSAFAQSREKITYSASLNPIITYPINTTTSSDPVNDNTTMTFKEFNDSISAFESYKLSLGGTVWVNYLLNSKWSLQTGLGYSEVGFTRKQENIQLGDPLFPGIGSGQLEELSNTTKNIDYNFRYQYISVPVLFNYYGKRSKDFKWTYFFTAGAAVNVLVKHQIRAELENFVVEGEKVYKLDSSGYEGSRLTMNLYVGGKFEYKVKNGLNVFGQPLVMVFPFSVSNTEMKSRPIGLQLNLGITYNFAGEAVKGNKGGKNE